MARRKRFTVKNEAVCKNELHFLATERMSVSPHGRGARRSAHQCADPQQQSTFGIVKQGHTQRILQSAERIGTDRKSLKRGGEQQIVLICGQAA